jgi:SAM-dependent methyltransferase
VHFQSLEDELAPVVRHLGGHLLDAGCGVRDIGAHLAEHGVERITRCDLGAVPSGVQARLESLPFADGTFDSVLCNAVLEHVEDPVATMRELARVVAPGGHVVAAVPFLQPFHAAPTDHVRFTADGLARLGRSAGLEVVEVLPVHSWAQTYGWLLWEHAREKGGRALRAGAWAVAYAISRRWNRTDGTVVRNANTFQGVFRRPAPGEAILAGWRERAIPAEVSAVPTMLVPAELQLLGHLAEHHVGDGAVVDAGCFLGGSSVALADGLRRNLARRGLPERPRIHSYDRFEVEPWMVGSWFEDRPAGASFRSEFDANAAPYRELIEVHDGDATVTSWRGGPIDLLFVDIAKSEETCDWVTWQFFGHLTPGAVVVQQDYLYHHWVGWLHVTMEHYAEHFEYLCDTEVNSVAWRCVRPIEPPVLRERTVQDLSVDEKVALLHRAARRFRGPQRAVLDQARDDYLQRLGVA